MKSHCRIVRYTVKLHEYVWRVPMPPKDFKKSHCELVKPPVTTIVDYFINNETAEAMATLTDTKDAVDLPDPDDFLREVRQSNTITDDDSMSDAAAGMNSDEEEVK